MKKTVFKLIALILSLTTFICLLPLGAVAADDTLYPTGCIPDDYGTITELLINNLNNLGDANLDNKITVADAKLILRTCANLEKIEAGKQAFASDVNMDGKVSIADAKQILRVVVGLDCFRINVDLNVGQQYVTDPMFDKGSVWWVCEVSPETGFDLINYTGTLPNDGTTGNTPAQTYAFTAKVPGTYELSLIFAYIGRPDLEIYKKIVYTFNVK